MKIWQVPHSKDKPYGLKYSLVYVREGRRIIGYDNAEGKRDHRHYRNKEYPYHFQRGGCSNRRFLQRWKRQGRVNYEK